MSGFHEYTEGRDVEVECNRCGYTRTLFLPAGIDLQPCRAPHPHSTLANPAECGGTSFDVKPAGASHGMRDTSEGQG